MTKSKSSDFWLWTVLLGATGLVVALSIVQGRHKGPTALEGKPAPALALPMLDGGKAFSLGAERGRVVMLDFWATWCAPCRRSMPALQRLWREYEPRGVDLLAVNTDSPGNDRDPTIREFLLQNGLSLQVALDGDQGAAQSAFNVVSLPTLVVLDRAGKVAFSHVGLLSGGAERELRRTLDAALAGTVTN